MSYPARFSLLLACALAACAESPENDDPTLPNTDAREDGGRSTDEDDEGDEGDEKDAGLPRDAGIRRDASSPPSTPRDAGGSSSTPRDAGSTGGGTSTNPLDDLINGIIGVFNPSSDAGAADAGKRDGG